MLYRISVLVLATCLFLSCNGKKETKEPEIPLMDASNGTYFSIRQFTDDQWKTYRGQPFGIQKFVYMNDKVDSIQTTAYEVNWGAIFKPFFESDISDPKFLGKYNFSNFKDDDTYSYNLFYEALDEKLFTRKLLITVDEVNNKIKSIYIETEDNKVKRKLLYIPVQLITIQEFENKKELRIEYRFLH